MADLYKKIAICVVMLMAIAVFIPVYWAKEPSRQEAAAERIKRDAMAHGAEFFVSHCAACHGKTGDNLPGKNLRQTQINPAGLAKIISRGIPGTPMPAFGAQEGGTLKKFEIDEVVTFIVSWEQPLIEEAIVHLKPAGGAAPAPAPVVAKPAATPGPVATPSPAAVTRAPVTPPPPAPPPAVRSPELPVATPTVKAPPATPVATPAVKPPLATATPRPPAAATATASPAAPVAGAGDAAKGKTAYGARCAMCHGADGGGGFAPALKGRDAASMRDVVRKGRGGMPAMNTTMLSDSDLENIGAFLASLK